MTVIDDLRAEVRAFLREANFVASCDAWLQGHDPGFSRLLGERGWLGMSWPARYGGHDRSALERFTVMEELLAAGAPVAAHWIADRQTGPLLLRFGTEAQRQRYLPPIARGEAYFVIGMSEPDSGSDLASVRTRAERVDGGWRVTGQKVWTSHAHEAHHMVALVRTSGSAKDRKHGLSQLIIHLDADGVDVRPITLMTGAPHFSEVVLDGVFVPDEDVVGTVGDGWAQVMAELAHERSGPERFLSTFPLLAAFIDVALREGVDGAAAVVGELTARLWALRSASLGVAVRLENGEDPTTEAAIVKDVGTRLERDIAVGLRALAPPQANCSSLYDRLLGQSLLSAPGFTLRGGTNEVLRGIIARAEGLR